MFLKKNQDGLFLDPMPVHRSLEEKKKEKLKPYTKISHIEDGNVLLLIINALLFQSQEQNMLPYPYMILRGVSMI